MLCFVWGCNSEHFSTKKKKKSCKTFKRVRREPCFQNTSPVPKNIVTSSHLLVPMM